MPKENTHLYFAHELSEQLANHELRELIARNLKYYHFGSVSPDTFYYGGKDSVRKISEYLHGKDSNPTNKIIFQILGRAKKHKSEKDLAFAFGYITHCVLDMVFHPVIYYLSGNYYDADQNRANDAIYLHRHLETYLDHNLHHPYLYSELIKYQILRKLIFSQLIAKQFKLPIAGMERVLKRKIFVLKLVKNDFLLNLLYLFYRPKLAKYRVFLGIFYGNLKHDTRVIPEKIDYRDIITGERLHTTTDELFNLAFAFSEERITAAYDYYRGKLSYHQASEIIQGESLDTGKVNVPVSEIKYTHQY